MKAVGNPVKLYGLNRVGLQRSGFAGAGGRASSSGPIACFFRSELNVSQAMERARAELQPLARGASTSSTFVEAERARES